MDGNGNHGVEVPDELIELAGRLFDLARTGETTTLQTYITAGTPINLTNDKGDTFLMLAAYHGHRDTVRMLCELGGDVNRVNDRGQTPLAGAVFKNEDDVVNLLVEHGADPNLGQPSAMEATQVFRRPDLEELFKTKL